MKKINGIFNNKKRIKCILNNKKKNKMYFK